MIAVLLSILTHNLFLTRFLVCARRWASAEARFELVRVRTCYEFEDRGESEVSGQERRMTREAASVIPDAWLLFARKKDKVRFPVLLEIDRGTAYRDNLNAMSVRVLNISSLGSTAGYLVRKRS